MTEELTDQYKRGYLDGAREAARYAATLIVNTCESAPNACSSCLARAEQLKKAFAATEKEGS